MNSEPPTAPQNPTPDQVPSCFPTVAAVAAELVAGSHEYVGGHQPVAVRLQVIPDDSYWALRWGDPSFDLDHHGHWGATYLTCPITQSEAIAAAEDLREQAIDDYYIR